MTSADRLQSSGAFSNHSFQQEQTMTVVDLYNQSIKPLSAADRFRLATLILNDIPPQLVVDASDEWSEEDYRDFNRATWNRIEQAIGESDDA